MKYRVTMRLEVVYEVDEANEADAEEAANEQWDRDLGPDWSPVEVTVEEVKAGTEAGEQEWT